LADEADFHLAADRPVHSEIDVGKRKAGVIIVDELRNDYEFDIRGLRGNAKKHPPSGNEFNDLFKVFFVEVPYFFLPVGINDVNFFV
jgi:hypothetical protein